MAIQKAPGCFFKHELTPWDLPRKDSESKIAAIVEKGKAIKLRLQAVKRV